MLSVSFGECIRVDRAPYIETCVLAGHTARAPLIHDVLLLSPHGLSHSPPNQEHFQQYLRQRASAIDPEEEQNRTDRLDAVEAGDEDDDDDDRTFASITTSTCQSSVLVTPYAGVGPMVMSTADQVP